MKIYLNQNNEPLGPYSSDEVRERLYRGDLQRSALACTEEVRDWVPVATLLTGSNAQSPPVIPPVEPIPFEQLRDSKEMTAFRLLCVAAVPAWILLVLLTINTFGLVILIAGAGVLITIFGELWFAAHVKTNAVCVSETQLPALFQVVQSCSQKLGMPAPDVYVLQQNIWNAFATKVLGRRMVVLLSGAVDSLLLKGNIQQLAWLVGHELAHHRAGHLDLPRRLADVGGWCVWLRLWYSRRAELTCDRAGLYCAGSLRVSQLALANLTVGAQLAAAVNVEEAANQWRRHEGEFFVRYRTLYSTHPQLLARMHCLSAAASELRIAS